LPNTPVPWSASRITSIGAFNPRAREKNFTRWQIKSLHREKKISGYVVVDFVFYFPIPLSTSKKKKALMLSGEILPTSCDCTNLQKFYEDCIKDILIQDDRNVAKITSQKLYGNKGKILIKVFSLQEYREINANRT
jgi:Holliday junction resolvase RusA-like endonuclease